MENKDNKSELILGLVLTLFAAILAVNELFAGKYGDDEIIANNRKTEAYNWYQAKAIKQTLVEGERDMLLALSEAGAIQTTSRAAVDSFAKSLTKDAERYKKEKKEILKGSSEVGAENWAQDVNGEMGKIIGAEQWQAEAEKLGVAGDFFDLATLFLQISLVMGAIGIVIQNNQTRMIFMVLLIISGLVGLSYSIYAWNLAN